MAIVLYPNVSSIAIINLLRTDLIDCLVQLYKNDVVPTPGVILADLTEADFSGYAEIEVAALLAAYLDPEGGASAQIPTVQFQHNGGATANTVYGFMVTTAGGALRLVGYFDAPIPMVASGDAIPLDVKFNFGG